MEAKPIRIEEIYVPAKRRKDLDSANVEALAESILEQGLKQPISVRQGNNRFVLISGLHRLEAMRALGEETISSLIVAAKQH